MLLIVLLWRSRRLLARAMFVLALLAALVGVTHPDGSSAPAVAGRPVRAGGCREHGGLPDRGCTPGAVRANVSLSAICQAGYSRRVRPPESYTEPLKLAQMREYGLSGAASEYEEDHLVALSLGGAPRDPANLWPQPRHGRYRASQKDRLESWAARMACARRLPLALLQREMASDWTRLYRLASGERVLDRYPPGG